MSPVINNGKDQKLMRNLLSQKGKEGTERIIHRFFNSKDEFIINSAYSIGIMYAVVNKLLIDEYKDAKKKDIRLCPCGKAGTLKVGNAWYCHRCSTNAI